MHESEIRAWRSLLTVVSETDDGWTAILPGWDVGADIPLDRASVPGHMRPLLKEGFHCWVRANIGCTRPEDLVLIWPGPDDPDHNPPQDLSPELSGLAR